jgi:hypothetical protein
MRSVQQHTTHINCNHTAFPLFLNSTGSMFSAAPGKQVPPYPPPPGEGFTDARPHSAPISFCFLLPQENKFPPTHLPQVRGLPMLVRTLHQSLSHSSKFIKIK